MSYEKNDRNQESVYSKRLKAGRRRTYFFDVRPTKGNDYYLIITESCKRFNEDGYDRHKIFLYKEDFNKFLKNMTEVVDHIKTELMPNYDFDAFSHEDSPYNESSNGYSGNTAAKPAPAQQVEKTPNPESEDAAKDTGHASEEVDKW